MNLSNVKLVVSDMDGTLLNSKGEVSTVFFDLFTQLKEKNIHFTAASGRQYNSIIHKLDKIKDDIFVIAENGGMAKRGKQLLNITVLDAEKVAKLVTILRTIKGVHIVLCGKDAAYIESKNDDFISLFQEYYQSYHIVDDLIAAAKTNDFLKIAVYHYTSSEKYIYPHLRKLEDDFLIKISSKNWLDISDQKANKGYALKQLQTQLNIKKSETVVFGDYHNDIEMLQEADFSFAMKNAHKDIKEIANYTTDSNDNFGVEKILKQLLKDKTSL